jgi:amino acid adenylation domain-containing protein
MKSVENILFDLCGEGVKLWVEGDLLRYKAPHGKLTPALKTEIADRKAEIIAFLRDAKSSGHSRIQPIPHDQNPPLSFAQQRLWFINQLEPDSSAYNLSGAIRLQGQLDVSALERTLQEIIRRHEALRTNFINQNGQPVQIIHQFRAWQLNIIDLQQLSTNEREERIQRLAVAEEGKPFIIDADSLLRATLLLSAETEKILLITMHHIVSDGWSIGILIQEIVTLYSAFVRGESSPLAELDIQYADFAVWQRQWLQGETLEQQISYWQQKLKGAPALLGLPTDHPRPPVRTSNGATCKSVIPAQLSKELENLTQQEGVTLFMTLLAAFDVLLYRYTGQTDIVVGSSIANRNNAEIENLIGFFVNTLVFRSDLSGNPTFRELLQLVREISLGAYAHQDLPFEMLVEILKPERNLSYSPLFQVMFVLQNAPSSDLELPGLTLSPVKTEGSISKFDISLSLTSTQKGLEIDWEYNIDLFEKDTIDRMANHFEILLTGITENPDCPIYTLPILTIIEQQQLLIDWNKTQVDYPRAQCIHQLFEAQVTKTPDGIAVVCGAEQLTYQELNNRSNQLARYLQCKNIKSQELVGICIERSIEMLISILAVWKAGAAYVPLDPNYPSERLSFMMVDAQVAVLLTQPHLLTESSPQSLHTIVLESLLWSELAQISSGDLKLDIPSSNLANVIYTSGSTGVPKGVMVHHQGLHNLAQSQIKLFDLSSTSRVLQFASLNFDASSWEILMAIGSGGTLYVDSKNELLPGEDLFNYLQTQKITHVTLPPTALAVLPTKPLQDLSTIIVAGETCSPELIRQWSPNRNFFNAYGPTEGTVCATISAPLNGSQIATIGRPISNVQVYILDAQLHPLPIGIPGELYIGGHGVAQGYLNRPDLTVEKFIVDPFSDKPQARLYKTGDLARYLADGNIEYLGRIDRQVKIRGFRIELGEIESAISNHPQVAQVTVIDREDKPGNKILVAYMVPQPAQVINTTEIRTFLKGRLPDYMLPAITVCLDELPVTPNGKIDRQALPVPDSTQLQSKQYVAPRNEVEEQLSSIWQEVLGIDQVGVHDNFFELGGHSLLATQMMSQIRQTLGVEVPLKKLFEASTIDDLALQIQGYQADSKILMPPLRPVSRAENLSLSFAQQRLWFFDQLEPGSPAYNMPGAVKLQGKLDFSVLEKTFCEVIRRHESLRTNFIVSQDGQPIQVINRLRDWHVNIIDLQEMPLDEQEQQVQELAIAEAAKPFNLETDSLIRAALLLVSETEQILLLTMHHIVFDGWSMGLLVEEIATLYSAFIQGNISPLSELEIQYVDFAVWQKEWLKGDILQQQVDYWQQQLAGAPALLELPTDRPRPPVQTSNGASYESTIPVHIAQVLDKLTQQEGVTLFMTLLAAFDTLLYRYTGQSDIVIGSPIANRNRAEIENLIGFFVNTLVLRNDLSGNPTFRELLQRVREVSLDAYAHQDLPFEMLVETLQPERNLSHSPLFQVMFILQNTPISNLELPGLTLRTVATKSSISPFDLTLSLNSTAEGLDVGWEYNTDLFDASTIERMSRHFEILLTGIAENPDLPIFTLPILTAAEQQKILVDWNSTQADYPQEQCVHQLFEAQVNKTPEAISIVCGDEQLTYQELNARANQLAHHLQTLGIKPEVPVGVCISRSIEMMVGILGILKAGGAYLPLDPTYPAERLAYMLTDAQVPVLLTQDSLRANLPNHTAQVVCLDTDWLTIAQYSGNNCVSAVLPTNLVYIIYTSGSTGKPKGTMIQHQSLVSYTTTTIREYDMQPTDKVLQFCSISFDVAAEEIYPCLSSGGALVMRNDEMVGSIANFLDTCRAWGITMLSLPTAYWHEIVAALGTQGVTMPEAMRLVIIAGERARPEQLAKWQKYCVGRPRLINTYGVTESTIISTIGELTHERPSAEVSVGKVIDNTQIYLLDKCLQPVPIGIPGEMYLGGLLLARGYLNRPDLTAEKFIPHPFSAESGTRIYKTGDLARYRADGSIECLGRIDQQVKIRGFRIELGEVEAAISKHSQVCQVTVIDREDKPGNKILVAYLVTQLGQEISSIELHAFLRGQLPDYMLPAIAICLKELPVTPNGKIDRQVLPAPDFAQLQSKEYVAPKNTVEEQLSIIWQEVLSVDRVGIHDNFFELGGHSLLATQLMSRIRQMFEVEIPLKKLFDAGTIDALALEIQSYQTTDTAVLFLPLKPAFRTDALPLSFAQQRLWFIDRLEPNSSAYNMPGAMKLYGQLDLRVLENTLLEIIRRHEALRTNFSSQDGQAIQVIHQSRDWQMTVVNLQQLPVNEQEEKIQQLVKAEAEKPFAIDTDSLIRATLLLAAETEQVLLLTMHHIVSDGWSIGILIQEIATIYSAFINGEDSPLPELDIQYVDFAVWQRQWLQGETLDQQLSYWQKQLAGAPYLLELPTDRPRPPVQTSKGATYESVIPAQLSQEIETFTQREGVTLFMTLLAAFDVLLYRYTGQVDIVVGSPIANRNHAEIENLIGFFVNTLVLRNDLSGNPTFRELLQRVREVSLGAYAHQDLPFEMLVETLQPERNLSHSPLFQVMFILQNTPTSNLELPGLTLNAVVAKSSVSPFDLTLSLNSTAQGLDVAWEYNTDLFNAITIERMAKHFEILLTGIVENPDLPIFTLPILTAAEQQQLLVDWNDTQIDYHQEQCVHQLFEAQVNKTPEAIAAVCGNEQLTYQELNNRANQLAHHLQILGVKQDEFVGLCVDRSLEMIVGMLAILKAGGAYVPLDPEYPAARLAYMVADSQIPLLLTQERLLSSLPTNDAQVICLDRDWPIIQQANSNNLVSTNSPDSLAYVIYTSGSTGQPKGVMVTQQNLTNFCHAAINAYDITSADRILQFASVSFDVAAEEIYPGLIQGASIYLRSTEMLNSLPTFWQHCDEWQLTLLDLPTAYWQQLTTNLANISTSVRLVIIGGERANPAQVRLWQEQVGTYPQLINAYGPTETTVEATCCNLSQVQLYFGQEVPIGKPLANMQVYILDSQLQLLPVGVPGELHIGGHGVTRGYFNRPDLTAEKFIVDPFSDESQACLYKTGDLVRYLADGNIEYLGRIDQQVKIRGFRIELGEVEAAISKHPQVAQVTVIDREDKPGNKVLVAYLVPQPGQEISSTELRTFLKGQLPDYMLPTIAICLGELPVTPNGKIDQQVLPAPDFTQLQMSEYVPPENDVEKLIADIWIEILGVNQVGIYDNFFELGGHSLLAVQLISKIDQQFQTNLSLSTLFQNTTIKQIASILIQPEKILDWSPLVQIKSSGSKRPFFCIPGGGGNPVYLSDLAYQLDLDRPFYGLQARGLDGDLEPHTNVEDTAKCYIQAIQSIQKNGPYLIGGHSFGGQVALEMSLQLQKLGQEVALLVIFDGGAPTTTINSEIHSEKDILEDDIDWLRELGGAISQLYETQLDMPDEILRCLDTEERFKYFQQQLITANLPIAGYKLKQLEGLLNIFKIQNKIIYETNDIFHGQIVLFQTIDIEDESLNNTLNMLEDWSKFSIKEIIKYDTPGNHYRMMSEPHVQILAANLRSCINEAVGG